jgi:CubicO group peptidase (beta-lactamase class C family)
MADMTVIDSDYDFGPLHAAMQRYVDLELMPGISSAVLKGRDLIDLHCVGWADREDKTPLDVDNIYRVFSNTKLVTSCAALLLHEEGCFQLDDPIDSYLPQLANRQVLRPDATDPEDTEPAAGPITIRHLMTHTSGLSYGLLDPDSLIFKLYTENKVTNPAAPLSQMVEALASLPLSYHPGTSWEYSVATDVMARLVEVITDENFGDFLKARIFEPLGMVDTDFHVPSGKSDRLVTYYAGADLMEPMLSGLSRSNDMPGFPIQSGGGGLFSTLPDMVALVRGLIQGDGMLLRPESMALITTNQLPEGRNIQFAGLGELPGKGHGLASAVSMAPLPHEAPGVVGEFWWGGIAGTQWWVSPNNNLAAVVMTQRQRAFSHPFAAELKKLTYDAVIT